MLEEARNRLRIKLCTDVLTGDWHCAQTSKKARHRPDWLTEFVRRVGNLDQTSVSSILESLNHVDVPTHHDWGDVILEADMSHTFQSIARSCKNYHRTEGGICSRCVMIGEAHGEYK